MYNKNPNQIRARDVVEVIAINHIGYQQHFNVLEINVDGFNYFGQAILMDIHGKVLIVETLLKHLRKVK